MLGAEIEKYFREHPLLSSHFLGTLAADQVKRVKFLPKSFAVINTDDSTGYGIHW